MNSLNIIERFIAESLSIEGICREPTIDEIEEHQRICSLPTLKIDDLEKYIEVYEPSARLRDRHGMNVMVGEHFPVQGGVAVPFQLDELLEKINGDEISAYGAHIEFETLHPFTDCNGRLGRAIWSRMMNGDHPLGFLHTWYYQTLKNSRG